MADELRLPDETAARAGLPIRRSMRILRSSVGGFKKKI